MTPLEAKVTAANKTRTCAKAVFHLLAPIFLPFVGQKILKKEGGLLKKLYDMVEQLNLSSEQSLSIYRYSSSYSLAWTVQSCVIDEKGHARYDSVTVYIGKLDHGTLVEMEKPPSFKTDFTVEQVLKGREELKKAKELVSKAEEKIYPFGEYD